MSANIPDDIPSSLPNAEYLYRALLGQLKSALLAEPQIQIAGLASGGAWLAKRLASDLGLEHFGVINVNFHRDDYQDKGVRAIQRAEFISTTLPFDVEGATIVLVDDVLDTGRTVRAALNELFDYGRPKKVALAVLADRHRRELPVDATYKGAKVELGSQQILVLEQLPDGRFEFNTESKKSN